MRKRDTAAYLVTLLVIAAAAQTRPDFSGTWKQNMGKSPTKSSWLKSYVNKIALQNANLKVTTSTVGDRGERTYDRTRVIGKDQKLQDREGDQFTTNVKWEGNTPVFKTVEKEHDSVLTSKEVWTLSGDGKTPEGRLGRTICLGKAVTSEVVHSIRRADGKGGCGACLRRTMFLCTHTSGLPEPCSGRRYRLDGSSYLADWPDGTENNATCAAIRGPLNVSSNGQFTQPCNKVQFETEVGALKARVCQTARGVLYLPRGQHSIPSTPCLKMEGVVRSCLAVSAGKD